MNIFVSKDSRVANRNKFRPLADDLSTRLFDRYQLGAVAAAFSEIIPIIWPVYDKTRSFTAAVVHPSPPNRPLFSGVDGQLDLATSHKTRCPFVATELTNKIQCLKPFYESSTRDRTEIRNGLNEMAIFKRNDVTMKWAVQLSMANKEEEERKTTGIRYCVYRPWMDDWSESLALSEKATSAHYS